MELSNLRILQALVDDPHLSRTADRLRLSQSSLSKKVQAIEEEIGFPLFERRGPRGLKPLPAAIELAGTAEIMLQNWETGLRKIAQSAEEAEHFILIGPQLALREIVLPWWIRDGKSFPKLEIEARTSSLSRVSLETIQAGAHAGILEHREELANYVCKLLYQENWGIVRHPGTEHDDLKNYRWGTYSVTENPVETWLVQRGKMPTPNYETYWEDLTALALWVSKTPGSATVLPWHAARWMAKRGKVAFQSLGKEAIKPLYLAYPRNSPHKDLIHSLLAYSRDFGESLENEAR